MKIVEKGTQCMYTSMRRRVYVTVGRPSVCLPIHQSVPSIDSSSGLQQVCCWMPCGQEISVNSCVHAAAPALSSNIAIAGADSQQKMLTADGRGWTHTHTHTRLKVLCPGLPRWASTRKVQPIWILLKQVCTLLQTDTTPAPNQQRQSTEGNRLNTDLLIIIIIIIINRFV